MMVLQSCNLAKNEVTTTSNFEESARSILSAEDSKLARFDKTSYEYEHVRPNLLWIPEVEKKYLLALWVRIRCKQFDCLSLRNFTYNIIIICDDG